MFYLGRRLFLLACMLLLAACEPTQGGNVEEANGFVGTDITGADFPKPLTLTDHTGQLRTMSDFAGKAVVLFFGFTHCPDVCPTTMLDLKNTMKLLGDQSDEVQVLFVTVDPERDTQEVLAQFAPSFDERFLGLRGGLQETAETLGNFKIYFAKVPSEDKASYTIDHSAGMYGFDKQGKVRLYFRYGQKPAELASDIKQLL